MRAPRFVVTAVAPATGAVCFKDQIDAYSEGGAIEKAKKSQDGFLALRQWPDAEWRATPKRRA